MRFAYADPPYLGCCRLYDHHHGEDGRCWDDVQTHHKLIVRMRDEFPDGWALSASTPSLQSLLPICPADVRIGAWVKSFGAFKKGVRPAYMWEPVIFYGGRNPSNGFSHAPPERNGKQNTPKDFIVTESLAIKESITLKKGLTGAKLEAVCRFAEWARLSGRHVTTIHRRLREGSLTLEEIVSPYRYVKSRTNERWSSNKPKRSSNQTRTNDSHQFIDGTP